MGAVASQGFCGESGCFKGMSLGSLVPDASSLKPLSETVTTYKDALKIKRPRSGSWTPSPHWATPAPPRKYSDMSDFCIEDLGLGMYSASEFASPSIQLDSDGPKRRSDDYSGCVRLQRSKFEVEQLVSSPGCLPQPMPREWSNATTRALIPTATYEMLSKVPAKLLDAQSSEAQALRRKLVSGATVVFVAAGLRSKRFILERAAALGVKSVVLDHPDSWSQELVSEGIIAKFLPVDMSQSSEEVFEQCLAHIKELGADGLTGPVDGITTFLEISVPLVARLCETLALPGLKPEAVDSARDKHRTRACLAAAGLPTPRNFLIQSEAQLLQAAAKVGFPAVLKPVSGAASLGVKKVESFDQFRDSYNEVIAELSSLVVSSGALVKGNGADKGVNASNLVDLTLLLEQYLDGCEVDIDVVMSSGEWCYAAVADNGPTLEPYFNETWAVCPSLLPKEKQRELKDLAVASVKALGFAAGVFHVECKYTSTGPQLIEVNARMGGGQVRECNLMTWGVDLVEETLFIALGIPSRPVVAQQPIQGVAYCYVNAKESGFIGSTECIQTLSAMDGVVWAKPLVRADDKVVGPADGLPTWVCDLCVTKPTAKAALDFLLKIEADLPLQIRASLPLEDL